MGEVNTVYLATRPNLSEQWRFLTPEQRASMAKMAGYVTTNVIAHKGWNELTAETRNDLIDVWAKWKRDNRVFSGWY